MADSKGRLPLHIAALFGHNKLLELFIQNGCLFRRCHEGNTALHYAAMQKNVETCRILLEINPTLLNQTNYNGTTALHLAAIRNNSHIVEYLLSIGAEIKPDHSGLYFSNYAIRKHNEAVVKEIVLHKRWPDIMELLSNSVYCPFKEMIEYLPDICLMVLDRYITEQGKVNNCDHVTVFDFSLLQPALKCHEKQPSEPFQYLKMMVHYKRKKLLVHPFCVMFLKMKWKMYGRWIYLIFTLYYITLSLTVTLLTLRQVPSNINYADIDNSNNNNNDNQTAYCVQKVNESGNDRGIFILLLFISLFSVLIKCLKIATKKLYYFEGFTNYFTITFHILLIINLVINLISQTISYGIVLSIIVMFMAWINLLLQMLRSQDLGIFVIMFIHVTTTVAKVFPLFLCLLTGFATVFWQLLQSPEDKEFDILSETSKNQLRKCFTGYEILFYQSVNKETIDNGRHMNVFSSIGLSFFNTLMMMMGEYKHTTVIIQPYLDNTLPIISFPKLTFIFYIGFVILIPITLINLTIGLAVGDIDKIRQSATQELISQQVYWLDSLEAKFPRWFYEKMCVQQWLLKPAMTDLPKHERSKYDFNEVIIFLNNKLNKINNKLKWNNYRLKLLMTKLGVQTLETLLDTGCYNEVG
uniref:Ion transport domain-containing protein n=1 Tax=Trichobilharzia regenti TaxID=157069 RepID=A0AA85KEA4_TRIRE|nr:unnamed protein product [Trichobilharzia regenti]